MKNILAVAIIGAAVGIFYIFVQPTYDEIKGLKATKADYDKALNNSQEAKNTRDKIRTKFNNITDADKERLSAFLPQSIDNIRLIIEINKIASRYNMMLRNAQVTQVAQGSAAPTDGTIAPVSTEYGVGTLSFTVSGTYEAYLGFIKDLEQSLRLLDITSVGLSTGSSPATAGMPGAESGPDLYDYKTVLNTYWYK